MAERIRSAEVARVEPRGLEITMVANGDAWPEAISDGLTLPCGMCGVIPAFDYRVDEETWRELAPDEHRLGVICLPCLDHLGLDRGVDVAAAIIEVQFIGTGKTVVLKPSRIVCYPTLCELRREDAAR